MEYDPSGKTGLQVSRICLGMMTYGTRKWRPWILDEAAGRPIIKRAVESGINPIRSWGTLNLCRS